MSRENTSGPTASGPIKPAMPTTARVLNRFEPMILPMAMSCSPLRAAIIDEANSGSVVIFHNAGKTNQSSQFRRDSHAGHFMIRPSAIAIGDNGNFATVQEVQNTNSQSPTFMGPALWSTDTSIFARQNQNNWEPAKLLGSHLDMLHQSPYCQGIAAEKDNVFWVFDGNSNQIVKYDFKADHGPGNSYHDDGEVDRYIGISITRKAGVPSHMVIDKSTNWMYICDTGGKRILRMRINSGTKKRDLSFLYETLAMRREMENPEWEVFAETDLVDPCGVDIIGNRLFVSDNATNKIIAYRIDTKEELARIQTTATSIKGIKIGPTGKLWYVDNSSNQVVRIDPK